MKISKLQGLIAAPFTPMDEWGNIRLEMIGRYASHLINSKVSGVFVCGTTGEWPSLTTEEREMVLEKWVSCADGKLIIISHVGGDCLSQSMELASHAVKSGVYAIGSIAPSIFKPRTPNELLSFLAPIASAAPHLPFYYYHMPSITGVNFPVSELLPLIQDVIPNFSGVKFTHSDFNDMQKCIAFENGRYQILHGFDEVLLCGLSLGAKAAVGSTFNFLAPLYLKIWKAFDNSDSAQARELQQLSVKTVNVLNKYGGAIVAGKAIMEFIGIDCGQCRLPLRKLTDNDKASLRQDLKNIDFFKVVRHKMKSV
ncbi:MAG: dihydrodipicolinate synthase family protein [Bacteroidia bacterium]|nr:dihydrodipicolinate synthase family protein [Bacteroidia bacterium]